MSQDVLRSSGVRAFPTFQFFVQGKKVDELKGADDSKLEQKVVQWRTDAGASRFGGQGNTLGGWDGVGSPPAPGASAASTRDARMKALEQRGIAGSAVALAAAAPVADDDEEASIREAMRLSLAGQNAAADAAAAQDAQDTADAEAQFAEEERASTAMDMDEEMVPVPVDASALSQLLEFGFTDTRARKGLVHGKNNLDAALAWLGEHENDPDIDQPYMVRKSDADKEAIPKIPLTAEERAQRVAELKKIFETNRKERLRAEKAAELSNEKTRREQGQNIQSIQEERDRLMRKRELEKQKKAKEVQF